MTKRIKSDWWSMGRLTSVLGRVYNANVYSRGPLVWSRVEEPIRRALANPNRYRDQMRLVLFPGHTGSPSDIRDSLRLRYPVYFGQPMTQYYNTDAVVDLFGYNPTRIAHSVDPNVRYAVLGPAAVASNYDIWVCHVWGVNLESKSTADYTRLVHDNGGTLDVATYRATTGAMLSAVLASAEHVLVTDDLPVTIRIPAVGLGAFLKAITDGREKRAATSAFVDALVAVAGSVSPEDIQFELYDLGDVMKSVPPTTWGNVKYFHGFPEGNMYHPLPERRDRSTMLVNPWDSRSFIGNGLVLDSTPDGFTVSGHPNNTALPNSSYLHNWFFCENIIDPGNFHLCGRTQC